VIFLGKSRLFYSGFMKINSLKTNLIPMGRINLALSNIINGGGGGQIKKIFLIKRKIK
jgi:hypothetical protein